ncbi:hypothetical protein FOA52_015394 [Chlamydomonas sp. UWO 241]|nr:hypothetical protein FOA52_015394 [Chlamydomonas sp. UWO 241]
MATYPPAFPGYPPSPAPPPNPLPPRPPLPPSPDSLDAYFGTQTLVTDANLLQASIINGVLFVVLFSFFVCLQANSVLYKFRLVSPTVTVKPPQYPSLSRFIWWTSSWAWIVASFHATDSEILGSCGLDALMMIKIQTMAIQLLVPICIVGGCVLIPLNVHGNGIVEGVEESTLNPSKFMRLTMTNMGIASPVLWVHFFAVIGIIAWAMWLLTWHYHQYVVIRQHYMKKGDNANTWLPSRAAADDLIEDPGHAQGTMFSRLQRAFRSELMRKKMERRGVKAPWSNKTGVKRTSLTLGSKRNRRSGSSCGAASAAAAAAGAAAAGAAAAAAAAAPTPRSGASTPPRPPYSQAPSGRAAPHRSIALDPGLSASASLVPVASALFGPPSLHHARLMSRRERFAGAVASSRRRNNTVPAYGGGPVSDGGASAGGLAPAGSLQTGYHNFRRNSQSSMHSNGGGGGGGGGGGSIVSERHRASVTGSMIAQPQPIGPLPDTAAQQAQASSFMASLAAEFGELAPPPQPQQRMSREGSVASSHGGIRPNKGPYFGGGAGPRSSFGQEPSSPMHVTQSQSLEGCASMEAPRVSPSGPTDAGGDKLSPLTQGAAPPARRHAQHRRVLSFVQEDAGEVDIETGSLSRISSAAARKRGGTGGGVLVELDAPVLPISFDASAGQRSSGGAAAAASAAAGSAVVGSEDEDDEFGDDWDVDEVITELPRWWGYAPKKYTYAYTTRTIRREDLPEQYDTPEFQERLASAVTSVGATAHNAGTAVGSGLKALGVLTHRAAHAVLPGHSGHGSGRQGDGTDSSRQLLLSEATHGVSAQPFVGTGRSASATVSLGGSKEGTVAMHSDGGGSDAVMIGSFDESAAKPGSAQGQQRQQGQPPTAAVAAAAAAAFEAHGVTSSSSIGADSDAADPATVFVTPIAAIPIEPLTSPPMSTSASMGDGGLAAHVPADAEEQHHQTQQEEQQKQQAASMNGAEGPRASVVGIAEDGEVLQVQEMTAVEAAPTAMGVLSMPSVRLRKTINTMDGGQIVAVNAQQYAVLVTDVNQDSLNEGARLWGSANVRNEGEGFLSLLLPRSVRLWVMHNYAADILPRIREEGPPDKYALWRSREDDFRRGSSADMLRGPYSEVKDGENDDSSDSEEGAPDAEEVARSQQSSAGHSLGARLKQRFGFGRSNNGAAADGATPDGTPPRSTSAGDVALTVLGSGGARGGGARGGGARNGARDAAGAALLGDGDSSADGRSASHHSGCGVGRGRAGQSPPVGAGGAARGSGGKGRPMGEGTEGPHGAGGGGGDGDGRQPMAEGTEGGGGNPFGDDDDDDDDPAAAPSTRPPPGVYDGLGGGPSTPRDGLYDGLGGGAAPASHERAIARATSAVITLGMPPMAGEVVGGVGQAWRPRSASSPVAATPSSPAAAAARAAGGGGAAMHGSPAAASRAARAAAATAAATPDSPAAAARAAGAAGAGGAAAAAGAAADAASRDGGAAAAAAAAGAAHGVAAAAPTPAADAPTVAPAAAAGAPAAAAAATAADAAAPAAPAAAAAASPTPAPIQADRAGPDPEAPMRMLGVAPLTSTLHGRSSSMNRYAPTPLELGSPSDTAGDSEGGARGTSGGGASGGGAASTFGGGAQPSTPLLLVVPTPTGVPGPLGGAPTPAGGAAPASRGAPEGPARGGGAPAAARPALVVLSTFAAAGGSAFENPAWQGNDTFAAGGGTSTSLLSAAPMSAPQLAALGRGGNGRVTSDSAPAGAAGLASAPSSGSLPGGRMSRGASGQLPQSVLGGGVQFAGVQQSGMLSSREAAATVGGDYIVMPGDVKPRVTQLQPGSRWNMVRRAMEGGVLADLPHHKSYSKVSHTFKKIFPDTFDRAIPVLRHDKVDTKLRELDMAVWQYERALNSYRLAPEIRPTMKLGFCGCWGERVDTLRHMRKKMVKLQDEIREARKDAMTHGSTPSWFVFFKTQHAAAVASQRPLFGVV